MTEKLGYTKGYLCVIVEDTMYDEPEGYKNYYPCFKTSERHFKEDLEGLEIRETCLSGEYLASRKGNPYDKRGYIRLQDAGSTKPILTESFPIPCPKVRKGIKTEWQRGKWVKLLKSGWIPA